MVKRRELLLGTLAAAACWPSRPSAQQTKRIGMLLPFTQKDAQAQLQADGFREELRRAGWREDRNLRLDIRWAGPDPERIRTHARELVASAPELIVARTTPVTRTVLQLTRSIPVLFVVVSDPLGDGFVASLARPGGNVTGFTNVEGTLGGKWLELLKAITPGVASVGVLYGPKTAPGGGSYYIRMVQQAGPAAGVNIVPVPIEQAADVDQSIAQLGRDGNAGLVVTPDVTTANHRALIIAAADRHRLPAVYGADYFTNEGALISYGIDLVDLYRRAAGYADRVLRGAKIGELPVQSPTRFHLSVNLKAAKTAGIRIPDEILVRADRVIGR